MLTHQKVYQGNLFLSHALQENTNFYNKNLKNYKFIDLFAGIGGMRIPFEELEAKCVFSSEWNKYSQQTYKANYGECPHGDITKIDASDIPDFDILLAGFPCQPFSNAGLKKGFEDIRGTLFFDICRIVDFHRPQVLLLENVKGFKNHDRGKTFQVVRETLNDLGYSVNAKILNAKDFGIPQNRERIYIVAFRDKNIFFNFPKLPKIPTLVGDILEKDVDIRYTISDKLWEGHQRRKAEHLKKGNGFGYALFNGNSEYTSTISARYYKDGSEILIEQENKNPRKLTPREAARIQGFPEEFIICVSDTQAYRQFGNSVPVPVVRTIATEIAISLNQNQNLKLEIKN
jgi:DNA (cytosine-5)-methyltransferase 1